MSADIPLDVYNSINLPLNKQLNQMSTVKITANPTTGQVFTQSVDANGAPKMDKNGNETGYIRVESKKLDLTFAYNGGIKSRSILIPMLKSACEKGIEAGLIFAGAELPGKIVRHDSVTPFYEGQKPMRAPIRDANNKIVEGQFKVITSGGAPVYRNEFFTENLAKQDVKLESYDVIEKVATTVKAESRKALA